jgi:hypothetical protein
MANLNFFATRPDYERVFAFIYGDTDFRVFESYSEFGQQLREYTSFAALANAYDVGNDLHGNGTAALLQLWSPAVMAKPAIERIKLIPHKCNGFTFRYRITGFGLVQLYLGGVHEQVVTKTHYGQAVDRGHPAAQFLAAHGGSLCTGGGPFLQEALVRPGRLALAGGEIAARTRRMVKDEG